MAPRFIWTCGIEMGSLAPFTGPNGGNARSVEASVVHTGNYSLETIGGSSRWSYWSTPNLEEGHKEMYLSCWTINSIPGAQNGYRFEFFTDNGALIGIRLPGNGDSLWDAYVDGAKVADGGLGVTMPVGIWTLIELYVKIDDTVGRIISKMNGAIDVDYTGDTEPDTDSFIEDLRTYNGDSTSRYDDYAIAVDDWCGDVRIGRMVPEGDVEGEWEPSVAGTGSNYARVDERPPSDADYNRASGTVQTDKYLLSTFDSEGITPLFVTSWARARKESAQDSKFKFIADDLTTEDINTGTVLTTSAAYYSKVYNETPTGGAWTGDDLENLTVGVESELP